MTNEFTIQWRTANHEEYSNIDTNNYFATLEEAQKDIVNLDIIENAFYYIVEVNTENGDVVNSWSVIGGESFWNEEDSSEEIISYLENLSK